MTYDQDLFDAEIGTPPPSTVDIDGVIARQRRRLWYQRSGLAVSGCAAAVAAVLVLGGLPGSGGPPTGVATGAASPAPSVPASGSATASAAPSRTPTGSPEVSARRKELARLTTALRQIMAQTLPGVQFLPNADGAGPLEFVDAGSFFVASAAIRDARGTSSIRVSVGHEDTQFRRDRVCFSDPQPLDVHYTCRLQPGPNGGTVEVFTTEQTLDPTSYPNPIATFQTWRAELIQPNDTSVFVRATNGSGGSENVQRLAPALTSAQVIAIATNPALAPTVTFP